MDQTLIITLQRDENLPGPSRTEILDELRVIGLQEVIDYNVSATISNWFEDKYPGTTIDDLLIVETRYEDPYYDEKAIETLNDIGVGYRILHDVKIDGLYDEDNVYDIRGLKDNLMEALAAEYDIFKSRNPEAAEAFVNRMHDDFGSPSPTAHKRNELEKLSEDITRILCSDLSRVNSTRLSDEDLEQLENRLETVQSRIEDEDSDAVLVNILSLLSRLDADFWIDYAMLVVLQ